MSRLEPHAYLPALNQPAIAHLPCMGWVLWMAFCGWIILFHTTLSTDLTYFLPREAGLLDTLLIQQMREGLASRILLIALEGSDDADLAHTSRLLAEALRSNPRFEAVDNGSDPELLVKLEDRLFLYRYLLSPDVTPERFEPGPLHLALKSRLAELQSPVGFVQNAWVSRDPTGEWQGTLRRWLAVEGPAMGEGVWFSRDAHRALLLARTHASGFDIDAQSAILDQVREKFEAVRGNPQMRLVLGGAGPLSVESNQRIVADAGRLSAINSLLVMAFLFLVYRSFRVLGLGIIPLASGVASGVAITSLAFGQIHGITLGFGATLVGVAADYPNHFFTHLSNRESPGDTMRRIWPTLRLGVLTNIAGFAVMLFSGFSGLVQLGVFAAAGLVGAALSTRWVIPAFMPQGLRLPEWVRRGGGIDRLPVWLSRFRLLPLVLTLGLASAFFLSGSTLWNDDIDALNPVPEERRHLDEALRQGLGAPDLRKLAVIMATDAESALRTSEALKTELDVLELRGVLGRYDMAALYLPSQQIQQRRQAALPDRPQLEAALKQAGRGLPFKAGAFQAFLDGVAAAKTLPALSRQDLQATPLGARVESMLLPVAGRWAALIPLAEIKDEAALRQAMEPWQAKDVHYIDLRDETTRLIRDYRREAQRLLGGSLVLIVILLLVGLRSVPALLRVFTPMLAAALCTALVMARISDGLNLYHLVSLLLVMGLSLDQALFFNRDSIDPEDRHRTLLSLLVCSSSTVLAFGTLALSDINILRAIGSTVALGAFLAVAFAAMLARQGSDSQSLARSCKRPQT